MTALVQRKRLRLDAVHPDGTELTGIRVTWWTDGRVQVIGQRGTLAAYEPGQTTPTFHSSSRFTLATPDGMWSFEEGCGCGG